ncbi:MAG: Autophagy protein 7 [Sclerophora amabilis]|nr:MAG: Autophagy protein 7 [Sclerophora amabilis]
MQFVPFASDIELPFYTSLASHKINHDKLDDSARKLLGLYEVRPNDGPEASCRMQVLGNALTSDEVPAGCCRAEGIIKNVNTIEEYKSMDKAAILHRAGRTIWEAIIDGTIYSCPSLLAAFSVISFADLKKYKFTYWFAFPALHSDPPWKPESNEETKAPKHLSGQETSSLVEKVQTWRYGVDARQHGFFLVKRVRQSSQDFSTALENDGNTSADDQEGNVAPTTPGTPGQNLGFTWEVSSLSSFESGFFEGVPSDDRFVAFVDPSTYPQNPGWMLRNLLVLIRQRWGLDKVQVLCYRDVQSRRDEARSVILNLAATSAPRDNTEGERNASIASLVPKITGWEKSKDGKLTSKTANLAEYLDPHRLADQSVDLNLKLMKWRIAPNLDLDKIKNTKCLLLGAGTLGSYVARNLMGWGVRKITFVDNGTVSFSNPVRQPLFNFQDCLEGGAKKAHRAAAALLEIYPGVDSVGHVMSVPMAGHPITDEKKVKGEFETLQTLVDEHDAIFLLMDTRESRWLPTVMGKAAGKIVMNAALGFDTFVVMRHGVKLNEDQGGQEEELGCYFCNDVVAPADSIKDQTLDQQCTVTRPGIAGIASALLVELLISILQHPSGPAAPAPAQKPPTAHNTSITSAAANLALSSTAQYEHPLGIIPHQLRGYLSSFQNLVIRGRSYDCCSACSERVLHAYRSNSWEFVKRALNERGYVEDLSGLTEVQRQAEKAAADIEWDDEEGGILGEEEDEGQMI